MRSTLVLSVRGNVPPLLLPEMPVAILCSEAELLGIKLAPLLAPNLSDCDSDRCILFANTHYVTKRASHNANWLRNVVVIVTGFKSSSFLLRSRLRLTHCPTRLPNYVNDPLALYTVTSFSVSLSLRNMLSTFIYWDNFIVFVCSYQQQYWKWNRIHICFHKKSDSWKIFKLNTIFKITDDC